MPEQTSTRYSPWEDKKEQFGQCRECRKKGKNAFGVLMRRRIFERGGDIHTEYKIVCPGCKRQTHAHRSKQITMMEWEGSNEPGEEPKTRNARQETANSWALRATNIALNREAEILKGDGSNGSEKSSDKT